MDKKYSIYGVRPKLVKRDGFWCIQYINREGYFVSSIGVYEDICTAYHYAELGSKTT